MVNYSLVLRSVNTNLIEINQAKARIKAAKAQGTTPKTEDTDLVKTEQQKVFAVAQYAEVMDLSKFAKHISTHGCVYGHADINAVLNIAVDHIREELLEGKKIRLGALGDFYITLSSNGVADASTFTAQNITDVKVQWEPGPDFKNLINEAEFNLVAPRSAQAKLIKAVKEGKDSVDLTSPDGGGNTTTGGSGSQGGSAPGGGSGSTTTGGSQSSGSDTGDGNVKEY
ncbi:MAG: HU family DNA-binding protein [Prevotella sp.]|nr:HU family DNA-binding protein [Prevotella sp.]